MKGFRHFWEALKFIDPRGQLNQHPFVQNATFGIEIEFIGAAAPFEDMKPEWFSYALSGSDFEDEFVQLYASNESEYEKDNDDFINYIQMNKKKAWEALWQDIESYNQGNNEYYDEYLQAMTRYWGERLKAIVKEAGFRIDFGQESVGQKWAVGSDGHDSELNLPVVEVRSGIMTTADIEKLYQVLKAMAALSKQYPRELMARGNTGLHVHVSNPNVGQKNGYIDIFSRLAAATNTDEDAIWDSSTQHDRSFERYANMNKPQDFGTGKDGFHDNIILQLRSFVRRKGDANPLIVRNMELSNYMTSVLSRNSGVNVTSEHPTVEYRYLSSMMVVENPRKVIEFIRYFIDHTAQTSNKDRIKFENDEVRIVLTKQPKDMIRIDIQNKKDAEKEWEDEDGRVLPSTYKYPKIPKPGLPRQELDKPAGDERDPNQPFAQWYKGLSWQAQNQLKQKARR